MELRRSDRLLIGLWAVILILLVRLFAIQIVDDSYKRDANNNSMVYHTIYPPRGIVYDRNGEVLVGNRICYDILVTPREVTAFDTLRLRRPSTWTPSGCGSRWHTTGNTVRASAGRPCSSQSRSASRNT